MPSETWTPEQVKEFAKTGREPRKVAGATVDFVPRVRCERGVQFTIPGLPVGKPRMTRRDKWKQRPCVMRYRKWADSARAAAGTLPKVGQIIALDWTAYFPPPASWGKRRRCEAIGTLHRSRPDRDNVDKAVLDSLFKSDCEIAAGTIRKLWGEPARVEVTVWLSQ